MLIYVILLLLIFVFNRIFLNHRVLYNKKYFLFFSFLSMALVVGLRRAKTGEDTGHYLNVFNLIKNSDWKTVLTSFSGFKISQWGESVEYLYAVLNKIVSLFTNEGQILLLVVSILTMALFARFIYININDHVFLATIVFLCNGLFMASFNGIREILAMSIVINSYDYLKNKKYKETIIITFIAFFIHMSSIVMLPFFLLFSKTKNYKKGTKYVAIICVALIATIPIIPKLTTLVFPTYSDYFTEQYWSNSYRGIIVVWLVELFLSGYIYFTKIKKDGEFLGINGTLIYVTLAIISTKLWAFSRIMTYFDPFSMFIFGYGSERIKPSSRKYYYIAFMLLMVLEYISYATVSTRSYTFFWSN